jgi:hypothetical protein
MRLGQLARKINISPSDIESHLISAGLPAESGINTRLSADQVQLVLKKYAPEMVVMEITEIIESPEEETEISPAHIKEVVPPAAQMSEETDVSSEPEVLPDLIKAPKIELQGLKVLGKIDLPEPKKKLEPEVKSEEKPEQGPATRNFSGTRNFRQQRPHRNPIEAQRLREAREAEKRKLDEARKKKELRTQAYLKTVYESKALKKSKEKVRENSGVQRVKRPVPNSFIGRIWHWLTQAD